MHLTYRPAAAQDIEACLEMLPSQFQCPPALQSGFAEAWRRWLRDGIMQMTILEDGDRPLESRRIAFGNSVFVTDEFFEESKTTLVPPISAAIVQRWLDGCSPILSFNAVRTANSGTGLNLLILHIGWTDRLSAEEVRWAKGKLLEALLFFFSGYQLKEVLQEIYSEEEQQRGLAAGALIKNNYAPFYRTHSNIPLEQRPCLIGGARSEVKDGCYLSPLFLYTPPRFFFKSGEQEVLRLALQDRGDDDIARSLSLSPAAVHKRWQTVYDRVSTIQPDFFPTEAPLPQASHTRGVAKRRHLLSYLRVHPEELRPVIPFK